jgi:predicted acetyltransferase
VTLDQRTLGENDLDQMWDLEREAFHVDPAHQEWWARWERANGLERFEGVFEHGRLIAMAAVLGFGQWFGARSVPMGGVRAVATRVEHRGRGAATLAIRATLRAMRARGECLSALFPQVVRPYRRLGWEIAGTLFYRHVAPRVLSSLRESGIAVRRATADDHGRIRACYARVARETNGFLDRPPGRWEWFFERHADAFWFVAGDEGYLLYQHHDPAPAGFEGFRIKILDLVATTPRALRALWSTVGACASVVPTAIFRSGPTDPLPALLDGLDVRVGHERPWMLRLIDAAAAIAARGWAGDARAAVPLDIVDEACPWNAGRHRLVVEHSRARLEPGGSGAVRLGIGALAALYSGWSTTAVLARSGLLDGGSTAERAALDRIFAGPTPWMLDEF